MNNKKIDENIEKNLKNEKIEDKKENEAELPFTITDEKEKERYLFFKKCEEYLKTFKLTRPEKSTTHEYKIIREAVNELTPLTNPQKLAKFLKVDTDIILYSIEKGYIDCLKTNDICAVKTSSIITFLKKFSILMKNYKNLTSNKNKKWSISNG